MSRSILQCPYCMRSLALCKCEIHKPSPQSSGSDADVQRLIDLLNQAMDVAMKIHADAWFDKNLPLDPVRLWGQIERNIIEVAATVHAWKDERKERQNTA